MGWGLEKYVKKGRREVKVVDWMSTKGEKGPQQGKRETALIKREIAVLFRQQGIQILFRP